MARPEVVKMRRIHAACEHFEPTRKAPKYHYTYYFISNTENTAMGI